MNKKIVRPIARMHCRRSRKSRTLLILWSTDHTMPQMTGAILAQKLKEIRPDIPVILCTGYSETISKEKAESMGIDGFVMKPLSRNELGEIVRRVLITTARG